MYRFALAMLLVVACAEQPRRIVFPEDKTVYRTLQLGEAPTGFQTVWVKNAFGDWRACGLADKSHARLASGDCIEVAQQWLGSLETCDGEATRAETALCIGPEPGPDAECNEVLRCRWVAP